MSHLRELNYFTNDPADWNYNELVDNPSINPYTNRSFKSGSYDGLKYNAVIMLKEILNQSNNIFNDDILEWVNNKAFKGSKSDYYDILSITAHLFKYILYHDDAPINYKALRKWAINHPFLYDSFEEKTLEEFEGDDLYAKQRAKEKYDVDQTYNKLFVKITNIYLNNDETIYKIKSRNFLIILQWLKLRIGHGSGLHKLC